MSGFMKQSFIILNLKLVDMMIKAKRKKRFEQEKVMMEEKWGPLIENDPFYNPNLTRDIPNFSLRID